jgi:hypothetical protein
MKDDLTLQPEAGGENDWAFEFVAEAGQPLDYAHSPKGPGEFGCTFR